jgi:nucleoside-diphosphate-sugar epimerase
VNRVLVTGAGGFIGRHALAPLAARGFEVHAVGTREQPAPVSGERWHRVDLLVPGEPARVVREIRPSHVLHFAWYAEHGKFWTSHDNLAWARASVDLLDACRRGGVARFVGAGSCAEYDWMGAGDLREDAPLAPATLYGACKAAVGSIAGALAREPGGLSAAWGRIFFLHGPHEKPARLVPSVIGHLLRGEPAPCSHGEQVRDFLHVEDVAAGFVALLDSNVRGAVNVASGAPVAVKDVVTRIGARIGRPDLLRLGALPQPPGDPPRLVADVRRLRDEVGFQPRIGLDEGLGRTIEWWRAALG